MKVHCFVEDIVPYKMGLFWFEIPPLGGVGAWPPKGR